jgi:regulator of sigma E protease
MVGGVTVNLILGVLIYAMILFVWGEKRLPLESLHGGIWVLSPVAEEIGFASGDKILSIRGEKPEYMQDVVPLIIYGGTVEVERAGTVKNIEIPENLVEQMTDSKIKGLFFPRVPFVIESIPDSSLNKDSGLLAMDKIVRIDSLPVEWFDEAKPILSTYSGRSVNVGIIRDGKEMALQLAVSDSGRFEVAPLLMDYKDMEKAGLYSFETVEYGFFESFPAGVAKAWSKLKGYVEQFKLIFNPDTGAYKSLGGFGRIGGMFPPTWEWQAFWEITAILSLILAFMNILPIPALDGGHVMFLLYEMIRGKAPNQKFLEKAQIVGMIILLALLLYANGNDIYRWLTGKF